MSGVTFYVGSYSIPSPWAGAPHAHGTGVVWGELDEVSGIARLGPAQAEINPSFVVREQASRLVWAITEPETGGALLAFREGPNGALETIGRLDTGSDAPCHVAIHRGHRLAFVAHYHGGAVAVLALDRLGRPEARRALVRPPTAVRNQGPRCVPARLHASLVLGADRLLVTDTGGDAILLYRIVAADGCCSLELLDVLALPAGTGPRHLARSRSGDVYVSNQNSGGISVVSGAEAEIPRLALRAVFSASGLGRASPTPSEIAIHPTADVCYLANRADDSLSILGIGGPGAACRSHGAIDLMGRNPRHFAIAPNGKWLVAANQDSDELTVFRIEDEGRRLTWTGQRVAVTTPTAIAF